MSDPRRLSDPAGEGTTEERELIEAARARGVPPAVKAAVWSAVVAQGVGAAASAAAATGSVAKGALLAGLWSWKGIAMLAVVGVGAATSVRLLHPSSTRSAPPATKVTPASATKVEAPSLAPPPLAPSPAVAEPPPQAPARPLERGRPARSASVGSEAPLPASRLAEEARSLVEARRLLRAGEVAAALSALERANREFARGRLAQEREALFIDALAQSGQRDQARQRAEAFLKSYPGSPHAADVKRHVEGK
jgi:type IV secretory pathway VirB10-like protein